MKISAIIVAKKTSVRVPNKNMTQFGDSTLLGRKIKQLKNTKIDEVVVGSDCPAILNYAKSLGATPVRRPDEVCDEAICSANKMIGDMIRRISTTDVVVWAHCTSPLMSPETYDLAIDTFLSLEPPFDSLISVDEVKEHLWDNGEPLNYNPWAREHVLANDLPPLYKQNGGIFIQSYKNILENSYLFGKKPHLFVTPKEESIDVNTKLDLKLARALL